MSKKLAQVVRVFTPCRDHHAVEVLIDDFGSIFYGAFDETCAFGRKSKGWLA